MRVSCLQPKNSTFAIVHRPLSAFSPARPLLPIIPKNRKPSTPCPLSQFRTHSPKPSPTCSSQGPCYPQRPTTPLPADGRHRAATKGAAVTVLKAGKVLVLPISFEGPETSSARGDTKVRTRRPGGVQVEEGDGVSRRTPVPTSRADAGRGADAARGGSVAVGRRRSPRTISAHGGRLGASPQAKGEALF